jgi:hypothetical protein
MLSEALYGEERVVCLTLPPPGSAAYPVEPLGFFCACRLSCSRLDISNFAADDWPLRLITQKISD